MILLTLLFVGATSAVSVLAFSGVEGVTNDPFMQQRGVTTGFEFEPNPLVRVGLSGAFYPNLGSEADWKPLTAQLVKNNHVYPDLSPMVGRLQLAVRVQPLRAGLGRLAATTGFCAGAGYARTEDQEWGTVYPDSVVQRHPTVTWGLSSEIGGKWVRGRLRLDRVTYLETVSSTTVEMKGTLLAALDLVVRL